MKPRQFQVWGWARTAIYGGVTAFILGVAIAFIHRGQGYTLAEKLPALLAPLAAGWISWRLYQARKRYADRILWTTHHGISVVAWDKTARDWLSVRRSELDWNISTAMGFWQSEVMWHRIDVEGRPYTRIEDYLNGCALEFTTEGPLQERRHGIIAKGLTYPKRMAVWLPIQVVRNARIVVSDSYQEAGKSVADLRAEFWSVLRHEVGHSCLNAMGVPQEKQHELMKAAGWGDA